MKKYWNEKQECMSLKERKKWQLCYLQKTLGWVYHRLPFYREKFDKAGIRSADIKSLEDLAKFPFTVKNDLRDNYPFGLCAVPISELVEIHASSGTTGKPIIAPYTKDDMGQWEECMARNFWAAGVRPGDMFQNALGMGLFTGGFGFVWGIRTVGCTLLPIGTGGTETQIRLMKDLKATVLGCTPNYALKIADVAKEMGINLKKLPLRVGVFGAEPWSDALRKEIEERLGIKAHEAYGLTELMGPGVAFSCHADGKYNLHINEDHIYPEIIDPDTGKVLPLGTKGELVLTSLKRQAMPMIRYQTKDITTLHREKCACGRTLVTMDRVTHRSDDMLIVNGVNIFPSQVESLLLDFEEVEPFYRIILDKKGRLDTMTVEVEAKVSKSEEEALQEKLAKHLHENIHLKIKMLIVPHSTIPRSEGKAKHVIDKRGK